ncbi:MAG: hypothetical protein AAF709_09465 [Pseudomonadota bacterium]
MDRKSILLATVAFAAILPFAAVPTIAKAPIKPVQVAKADAVAPKAGSAAVAGEREVVRASVDGFRSAKFGMSERDVRRAMKKDFSLSKKDIAVEENKQERTRVLAAEVKDLLPGGGATKVSYVFGYKTDKLIQVSAVWSGATDKSITAEQLYSNANQLQRYFTSAGFEPSSIAMNVPTADGVIMFRGSDAQKRTTLLMLRGKYGQTKDQQRVLMPSALMLFYVKDAEKPDIYRLPKGLF